MSKLYAIRISSQKGGVGKTVVAVNLAVALKQAGYKVLLVDADTANPSIGFHLGIDEVNIGLKEVLDGKASIRNAVVIHNPTGLHVLPGTVTARSYVASTEQLKRFHAQMDKVSYDFMIVDTSPGYFNPELSRIYDEALILSTPDMSSAASAMRLAKVYDDHHIKHNLSLNLVKNKRYELHIDEIEELYEGKALASLPFDEKVPISVAEHIPAYLLDKRTPFSKGLRQLAHNYASRIDALPNEPRFGERAGILGWLLRLFGL